MVAISSALALAATLTGCHSHFIEATITNGTSAPIRTVQVDYPSASFGTQGLGPGQVFHYRFKLLGSGALKLTFSDANNKDHEQTGPTLTEGDEGKLEITFTAQDHAIFQTGLRR